MKGTISIQKGYSVLRCIEDGTITTGMPRFAVCPRHMAKPKKHSAKPLPSVTLGKRHSAYTESLNLSLPSAKTDTRQRLFEKYIKKTTAHARGSPRHCCHHHAVATTCAKKRGTGREMGGLGQGHGRPAAALDLATSTWKSEPSSRGGGSLQTTATQRG